MATTASEETSSEGAEQGAQTGPSPKEMTPGQRLAARKAAKARRKAELKGTQESKADEVASEVEKAAVEFTDFWTEHQSTILVGIGAFLALAVGVLLWSQYSRSGAAAEADALQVAVEAQLAPVDEDAPEQGDDPVFASVEDRGQAALKSYESLEKSYPDSPAASVGLLGKASAQMALGEYEQAAKGFEAALHIDVSPALRARALEGKALALEAAGKADDALASLTTLGELADGLYADVADNHRARILQAQGKRQEAIEVLVAAYERLDNPEPGAPERAFTRNQIELRLLELDSSKVDRSSVGGGPGGGMTQEQLQELIRQMQQNQPGNP